MVNYKVTYSGKFKKDFKKYQNQTRELNALIEVLEVLSIHGASGIPKRMKPHKLIGEYRNFWECHILPDFLLIWDQGENPTNFIHLVRLGTHSELF